MLLGGCSWNLLPYKSFCRQSRSIKIYLQFKLLAAHTDGGQNQLTTPVPTKFQAPPPNMKWYFSLSEKKMTEKGWEQRLSRVSSMLMPTPRAGDLLKISAGKPRGTWLGFESQMPFLVSGVILSYLTQLRNCLHLIDSWAYLWGIFLSLIAVCDLATVGGTIPG